MTLNVRQKPKKKYFGLSTKVLRTVLYNTVACTHDMGLIYLQMRQSSPVHTVLYSTVSTCSPCLLRSWFTLPTVPSCPYRRAVTHTQARYSTGQSVLTMALAILIRTDPSISEMIEHHRAFRRGHSQRCTDRRWECSFCFPPHFRPAMSKYNSSSQQPYYLLVESGRTGEKSSSGPPRDCSLDSSSTLPQLLLNSSSTPPRPLPDLSPTSLRTTSLRPLSSQHHF